MAILDLLYRKKRTEIGLIELDATISESHQYNSTVTKYPIEDGSDISDHIFNEPVVLSISGIVSDFPMGFLRGKIGSIVRNEDFERSKSAMEELLFLRDEKSLMNVITGLKEYESMVFTSLVFNRNNSTGSSLQFTATMTQLQQVNSETISFDEIKDDFKNKGAKTTDKGKQDIKSPTAAEGEKASLLFKAAKAIKGAFQ